MDNRIILILVFNLASPLKVEIRETQCDELLCVIWMQETTWRSSSQGGGVQILSEHNNKMQTKVLRTKAYLNTNLSYTTQIVPLEIVALLSGQFINTPYVVWIGVMFFHDIFPWHCDRGKIKTGWRRDGGHISGRNFRSEAQPVIWQLKCKPCLCTCERKDMFLV